LRWSLQDGKIDVLVAGAKNLVWARRFWPATPASEVLQGSPGARFFFAVART
jgi:hypothetical protein